MVSPMKTMYRKRFAGITYIKYFLSYMIILAVLIVGFFFVIRNQITTHYFDRRSEQTLIQLDNFTTRLNNDILYLTQVDHAIATDQDLRYIRHNTTAANSYLASKKLHEYIDTAKLISSIIYLPSKTNTPIATQYLATYEDGVFHLTGSVDKTLAFDIAPYMDAANGQLVFCSDKDLQLLLYLPPLKSSDLHIYFYILDTNVLTQQLHGLISEEINSIALVDDHNRIITGINTDQLSQYLTNDMPVDGIRQLDSSTSLCVRTDNSYHYSVVATLSNDFLTDQINAAFTASYPLLAGLSVIGFCLIMLSMKITYAPLYRLTKKLIDTPTSREGYLTQLDLAFSQTEQQMLDVQKKLNNYRLSMKQSLLDSMLSLQCEDTSALLPIMDLLFDPDPNKRITLVRSASSSQMQLSADKLLHMFSSILSSNGSCVILNSAENDAVFLIIQTACQQNKALPLKDIAENLHAKYGLLFAISNSTSSPMELPSLYEELQHADDYWPFIPVVELHVLLPAPAANTYPQEQMDYFAQLLSSNNFEAARILLDDLFRQCRNQVAHSDYSSKNFLVRSILVDILTILTNQMNLSYIDFQSYSDLYFEALYYCRSCSYLEKEEAIKDSIHKLISLYEKNISEKQVVSAPLMQLMEEFYCEPNFSIYTLADHLHVSVSHVSFLFKKDLNTNFSDLLWKMRLEKASELLLTTDMTVNEISAAIGYTNTSSFCRKFKQKTGVTPLQFRARGEQ